MGCWQTGSQLPAARTERGAEECGVVGFLSIGLMLDFLVALIGISKCMRCPENCYWQTVLRQTTTLCSIYASGKQAISQILSNTNLGVTIKGTGLQDKRVGKAAQASAGSVRNSAQMVC